MADAENEPKKVIVKKVIKKVVSEDGGSSGGTAAPVATRSSAPKGYAAGPVIDFSKANVTWTQEDIAMIKNLKDATTLNDRFSFIARP